MRYEEMEALLGELRASAGLGYTGDTLEALLLMPDNFRLKYIQLQARALKPAVTDSQGRIADLESKLGKAGGSKVTSKKGQMVGAGAGGAGKKYKTYWTVRDDYALGLKARVDRKLREIGRLIEREWVETKEEEGGVSDGALDGTGVDGGAPAGSCLGCGRLGMDPRWVWCPWCGGGRA